MGDLGSTTFHTVLDFFAVLHSSYLILMFHTRRTQKTETQYGKNEPRVAVILLLGFCVLPGPSIQSTTVSPASHVCLLQDGSMRCCSDYYQTPNGCQECVGSFGFNCSVPCPQDYFGPSCASMCQCGKDECDAKLGCPKDMNSTMKSFKTSDSSQAVFPNSTPESLFQKLSLTNWVLIFTSAFVVVSVAIGCVIFVRNKAEREQRRNQNDFSSEMEVREDFDNATKIPNSGYI